jgi:hypothetical protein
MQIINYLASTDLEENDMKLLKSKPIWPKIDGWSTRTKRCIISDLYTPSKINFELGLPLINWNKWWSRKSLEGSISSICGLFYMILFNI